MLRLTDTPESGTSCWVCLGGHATSRGQQQVCRAATPSMQSLVPQLQPVRQASILVGPHNWTFETIDLSMQNGKNSQMRKKITAKCPGYLS